MTPAAAPKKAKPKARAPRPVAKGREAQAKAVDVARQVCEIKVRGEVVGRLAIGNVPLSEKEQVRRQVRASWWEVLGEAGIEMDVWNLTVLVWLARRASGEPDLMWGTFVAGWDDTIRGDQITLRKLGGDEESDADDDEEPDADPQP